MKQQNKTAAMLLLGFVGALMLLFGLRRIGMKSQNPQVDLINSLNKQSRMNQILSKVLVYQAYHETGGFKSKVFIENNNPFGMKEATVRPKAQSGTKNGYANYDTLDQACTDLVLWLDYNNFWAELSDYPMNENSYIVNYSAFLKRKGYYEDSQTNYLNGMLNAKNKLQL